MICNVNLREPSGGANLSLRACRSWAPRCLVCELRFCWCYSLDAGLPVTLCTRYRASKQLKDPTLWSLKSSSRPVRGGPSSAALLRGGGREGVSAKVTGFGHQRQRPVDLKEAMSSLSSGTVMSIPVSASSSPPPSKGGVRAQWFLVLSVSPSRSHCSRADVFARLLRNGKLIWVSLLAQRM